MAEHEIEQSSTTDGLPVARSLGPTLLAANVPKQTTPVDMRVVYISFLSVIVGILAGLTAQLLIFLIRLITNVCFHGTFTARPGAGLITPLDHPGAWVIAIPIVGAIIIGLMARFGSRAVAGHGIPEAMEQVLTNESRIPLRLTFLKPLGAAISIGTGAPYGAEGPIIATGGALGSVIGQFLATTAHERKVLLAAGASAGIAAAFNAPIASVLLAVELLLFEFRAASLIPVGLACVAAASMHIAFEGKKPFFTFGVNAIDLPTHLAEILYVLIGAIVGVGAVVMTRAVYAIEHVFEHMPIHWMWQPAVGAIAVGVIGWRWPQTFGSGYYNLNELLGGDSTFGGKLTLGAIAMLGLMKFISWTISLGSGTSGGTLAPVFTIGGALGAVLGYFANQWFPGAHVNVGMAALVGMVGIFAGASRALLTSVVFAIETTMQPASILPAMGGCIAAYLVSSLLMRHSIMTEKMARSGVRVPEEYQPDFLDRVLVRDVIKTPPVTLRGGDTLDQVRAWIATRTVGSTHQGFPVLTDEGFLAGVVTRRDLLDTDIPGKTFVRETIKRHLSVVYDDCTLRQAADHMVTHEIGRLPVISRKDPTLLLGIITRSDLLSAHRQRIRETSDAKPTMTFTILRDRWKSRLSGQ